MIAKASSSEAANRSMAPLRRWMAAPPSSSLLRSSPVPLRTTGGPAVNSWPIPVTITARCDMTRRAAPSPTTGPRHAATTGTSDMLATTASQAGLTGT